MIPPPPSSTLFPYTTLFRSLRDVKLAQLEEHRGLLSPKVYSRCHHVVTENGRVQSAVHAFESDRKSTRLNSSHTVISYAVFCLKKKTATSFHYRTRASYAED